MKNCLFFLTLITISNCNSKNSNYIKAESIMSKDVSSGAQIVLYGNGNLKYLIDSTDGKLFGNFFKFYESSYLSTYSFMINPTHATYREIFDSETHKIINIEGNPIVYKMINADSHPDSIYVKYLITNFSYDDISFQISDSGRNFHDMPLSDSLGEYSNLKFLNAVNFIKDVKNVKRFYLIGKFSGRLKNTSNTKIYYDTIDLSKR